MRSLKEKLKEGVPARYQQKPEFNIFLQMIEREHIATKSKLKRYLNSEIKRCEKDLEECASRSTFNRKRSRLAKKLDFLRLCHDKLLPYCQ